ncbi:MAG: helix-turn-helix domain-containing protein [Planctomycetes bacterium]|nr:helix-turn-helix domain-containing protein [Planctomycetota bacterium]
MQVDPLLVNADAACEMLSISRSFFYEQISSKRIPAPIKLNRKSLWSVESLKEWVNAEASKVRG